LGQRSRKRRASAAIPDPRNSSPEDGVRRRPAGGESSAGDRSHGAGGLEQSSAGDHGAGELERSSAGDHGAGGLERGYARGRQKDAEARAALKPLKPGERPLAVKVAAVLAAVLLVANLTVYLVGWEVQGTQPTLRGMLIYSAILGAAAVGMWLGKYWAVLGFQMLLGITIVFTALGLLRASNWEAVVFCVGVLVVCVPLFWFLIRAMARLQMPTRTR
jgi:hypothetical protein